MAWSSRGRVNQAIADDVVNHIADGAVRRSTKYKQDPCGSSPPSSTIWDTAPLQSFSCPLRATTYSHRELVLDCTKQHIVHDLLNCGVDNVISGEPAGLTPSLAVRTKPHKSMSASSNWQEAQVHYQRGLKPRGRGQEDEARRAEG